jgi:hypothetical protein
MLTAMKKFFWLILLILASCEKDTECKVTYKITDSVSGFDVRYLNESSELITEKITTQSAQDVWNYSFTSEEGGIVFLSANYDDPGSAIKVQIYVDGKIYKQAASRNDTTSFITVSGTIPIKE